ncbi:MAG: substrate-binding domain-containing protein, partial [Candidatus Lokiarchaeota archaeon]|nr:substrate-binding domain-containing protein [Candidatus Lokiarchaeota archaeon]
MKRSTSWIIGGFLIVIVGGVVITGYFTNWFGLVPEKPEYQTLSLRGSTTVTPIALGAATAYMTANPLVDVQVTGGGSSAGVSGAADGVVDIGMASRGVKNTEFTAHPDLIEWPICADGIAVIVHPNNPIDQLNASTIKGIFNGTITNWSNSSAFGGSAWVDA